MEMIQSPRNNLITYLWQNTPLPTSTFCFRERGSLPLKSPFITLFFQIELTFENSTFSSLLIWHTNHFSEFATLSFLQLSWHFLLSLTQTYSLFHFIHIFFLTTCFSQSHCCKLKGRLQMEYDAPIYTYCFLLTQWQGRGKKWVGGFTFQ